MTRILCRTGLMTSICVCAVVSIVAGPKLAAQSARSARPTTPSSVVLSPATQSAAGADAAAHKQWMNDASEAQENFRFALTDRDQKAAQEALVTLESLMGKTEAYWTAKKTADGVKLAKEAHDLATKAVSQFKAGNLPAAQDSFDKMGASCNACHDLHLEKR